VRFTLLPPGRHGCSGDVFITKLSPDGSALVYSSYLGGSANDARFGIAVAANGNTYVTGYTNSSDFPTTSDAAQSQLGQGASQSAFIAKVGTANQP